jgi:hypothetical protein
MKTGIELIAAERKRQIEAEGWTAEHDAQHKYNELALAACYYTMPKLFMREYTRIIPEHFFPPTWDIKWAKRGSKSRIQQLAVAGALIAAEIDRLQAIDDKLSENDLASPQR